jgi:hypothetical protein
MTTETEMLRRQVKSMKDRLQALGELAGLDLPTGGGEIDKLTLKIEEFNELVTPYAKRWVTVVV